MHTMAKQLMGVIFLVGRGMGRHREEKESLLIIFSKECHEVLIGALNGYIDMNKVMYERAITQGRDIGGETSKFSGARDFIKFEPWLL